MTAAHASAGWTVNLLNPRVAQGLWRSLILEARSASEREAWSRASFGSRRSTRPSSVAVLEIAVLGAFRLCQRASDDWGWLAVPSGALVSCDRRLVDFAGVPARWPAFCIKQHNSAKCIELRHAVLPNATLRIGERGFRPEGTSWHVVTSLCRMESISTYVA